MQRKVYKMKKITALLLLVAIALLALVGCGDKSEQMGTGACSYLEDRYTENRRIFYAEFCIENYGRFVLLLDSTAAPRTVAQFSALIRQKFYDGKTFHFVNDKVIQGGCPYGNGSGSIESTIVGEFPDNGYTGNDLEHRRGTVAMVRGNEYDSASCQFFICRENYHKLNGQYAVFGYIVEGLSVIDEMASDASRFLDTSYEGYDGLILADYQPKIKWARILDDGWTKK